MIEKYNSTNTVSYDGNLFPDDVSDIKDPSKFEVLKNGDWRALKDHFNILIRS